MNDTEWYCIYIAFNLDESTLSANTQTHMYTFSHRVYAASRRNSVYHSFFLSLHLTFFSLFLHLSISPTNTRLHAGYVFVAGTDTIPGHQRQDLLSPSLILMAMLSCLYGEQGSLCIPALCKHTPEAPQGNQGQTSWSLLCLENLAHSQVCLKSFRRWPQNCRRCALTL